MNLYEVLGVGDDATPQDIKAAYRKLARENHPDKTRHTDGPDTTAKFQEIRRAYDVLSDSDKREAYDNGQPVDGAPLSPEQQIDAAARDNCARIFDEILSQLDESAINTMNVAKAVTDAIEAGIHQVAASRRSLKRDLRKLRNARRRLKVADYIFRSRLRDRRLRTIREYKEHRFLTKVGLRMRELAADMEYAFEPPAPKPSPFDEFRGVRSVFYNNFPA